MWNNCNDGQSPNVDPCDVRLICTGNAGYNNRILNFIQPFFTAAIIFLF